MKDPTIYHDSHVLNMWYMFSVEFVFLFISIDVKLQ